MLRIDIITIFPQAFDSTFSFSIIQRAVDKNLVKIFIHNLRDYSQDKHKKVDAPPYGGGPGMVMRPEPLFLAVENILSPRIQRKEQRVILLSPQGETFNQDMAKRLLKFRQLILICGRYEGVDERVREALIDEEISIGDYILSGGEIPSMVVVDCLVRLLPQALGDEDSRKFESFENKLLDFPQYTRPRNFRGLKVPDILLSGNHKKIESWRIKRAIEKTKKRRPDILDKDTFL